MVFYHHDVMGSTVASTVPGLGGAAEAYVYSDFGAPAGGSYLAYQFAGYRYDPETGLYYVKARYYNPTLGRFLQTDPIGTGGGNNLYAYVGNDPINLIDPTGLSAQETGDDSASPGQAPFITNDMKDAMMQSVIASKYPGGLDGSDTRGGLHEESGYAGIGPDGEADMIVPCQPGPVAVPGERAHTTWTPVDQSEANNVVTPDVFWHVHPEGSSSQAFVQGPSAQDQAVAASMNAQYPVISIVLGAASKQVYIYNCSNNVQVVSFNNFFKR
jgi:RHS repeat-associated protein